MRRAFTLIELLVVIAVIGVLLSILLPSLSGAREAGRSVVCQAHQRGLVTAMANYEADHRGYLVGPNTSGSDLHQGQPYVVGSDTPTQDWDFISPLLGESMGFPTDHLEKFQEICMTKFRCPSNAERYTRRFTGPSLPMEARGEQPITLSYLTPAYFQMYPSGVSRVGGRLVESSPVGEPIVLPRGYAPRIDKIGVLASKKIMSFEGARYWDPTINGFDYSTVTNGAGLAGTPQGNFLSRGSAFRGSGENYLRDPGSRPSDILKRTSLRHSELMNAAMFDGHVESLNNVQSADPSYYAPSRSRVQTPIALWYYIIGPADSPYRRGNAVIP